MKIQIVQIDPQDTLGPDLVLHTHTVPTDGGAVNVVNYHGHVLSIEESVDGKNFILSSGKDDYIVTLVPYEDGTALQIKLEKR